MSGRLALDANGYAEILGGTPTGERLCALLARERTRLVVLMPVIGELLQKVATPQYVKTVRETFYQPLPEARRIAPEPVDWIATGELVARMAAAGYDRDELRRRNFYIDLHVAVMCRARGITLLTRDRDHERIRPHVGHATEPFPV